MEGLRKTAARKRRAEVQVIEKNDEGEKKRRLEDVESKKEEELRKREEELKNREEDLERREEVMRKTLEESRGKQSGLSGFDINVFTFLVLLGEEVVEDAVVKTIDLLIGPNEGL